MKVAKAGVLALAGLVMMLSIKPLAAGPTVPFNKDPEGGGGYGESWTVTCVYDGHEMLTSKTCVSGGSNSCSCN